jgi:hypothetical protein
MEQDKRTRTLWRIGIACAAASIVTGICLNVSWSAAARYLQYPQYFTVKTLKRTDSAIKAYRQKQGTLPQKLSELSAVPDESPPIHADGTIWDSWQHPLLYKRDGNNYVVVSHGRDGKPGGIGLDCDLSNVNPQPPEAEMPFLQVVLHPLSRGIVWMSLLSGAVAFIIIFTTVKPVDLDRQERFVLLTRLVATLIATLLVATFITLLHVPTGH